MFAAGRDSVSIAGCDTDNAVIGPRPSVRHDPQITCLRTDAAERVRSHSRVLRGRRQDDLDGLARVPPRPTARSMAPLARTHATAWRTPMPTFSSKPMAEPPMMLPLLSLSLVWLKYIVAVPEGPLR